MCIVNHCSCTYAWIFLAHATPRPIITFTNKQNKTVPLSRCPQNLPKHFPFVACLSTHYYPAFLCFSLPFFPFFFTYLSSDGETGDWLFGFLACF